MDNAGTGSPTGRRPAQFAPKLLVVTVLTVALVSIGALPALAAPARKLPTVAVWPGPRDLAETGGVAKVRTHVTYAVHCRIALVNKRALVTVAFSTRSARCSTGRFDVEITTGPNVSLAKAPVVLEITALGAGGAATTRVEFKVAGRPEIPGPAMLGVAPTAPTQSSPTEAQSVNWSGYVVPSPAPVTEASGEWVVPTLDCAATPSAEVGAWVGTGGAELPSSGTSGTLLQTGVEDECLDGAQVDLAFWELYPSTPNVPHNFSGFSIAPGDDIQASVYEGTTGAWVTRVDDRTTGVSGWMVTGEGWGVTVDSSSRFSFQGSTAGLTYSGGTTAEWIVEDPGLIGDQTVFADYGTITFDDVSMAESAWSLFSGYEVTLLNGNAPVSSPSLPIGAGAGFVVTYSAP